MLGSPKLNFSVIKAKDLALNYFPQTYINHDTIKEASIYLLEKQKPLATVTAWRVCVIGSISPATTKVSSIFFEKECLIFCIRKKEKKNVHCFR